MGDIQTALDAIKAHQPERQRYISYYDGNHPLAFATEKFKTTFGETLKTMRDNLCPIVVDALADRMEIINFSGENEESAIATKAWELWQRELMESISFDVHVEALKTGAAYLMVWADEENAARFYLQDSRNCAVIGDEETDKPLFAAKQWKTKDEFIRLTLYYPDRIEKYITSKKQRAGIELKETHFVPVPDEDPSVDNPYGIIPMFKFECAPALNNAIPLQDSLNKTMCDKLVAMEFAAFRQRWATGLELPSDEMNGIPTLPFKAGVDRLWFTDSDKTKFGDFEATDIEQFLKVADNDRLEMARVSGTPLHYFSINISDAISGKALKTLESRFTKKIKRLSVNFGAIWARVMGLALTIEGTTATGSLTVQWESPEQRDEKEIVEVLIMKKDIGVDNETLQEEYGYTPEDIAKFKAAKEEAMPVIPPVVPPAMAAVAA